MTSCPYCGGLRVQDGKGSGTGVDWKSAATIMGYPLVHVAWGRDEAGRLRVARGIVAVGQFAIGIITVAQFGVGVAFGLGQFMIGIVAIGQVGLAALFGAGQFATGYVAIGQCVLGYYGIAQLGLARFLWSPGSHDPEAVRYFVTWGERLVQFWQRLFH